MIYDPTVLEFFAGSGLVRQGLNRWFNTVWANDVCAKKAAVYNANFGFDELRVKSIEDVSGSEIPAADLAWASFPCQDLSLAGKLAGMDEGSRSGLFWKWLSVLDEMEDSTRPRVLAVENVVGWLISKNGDYFKSAYYALRERGYIGGALVIDAKQFVPQSRPRAFFIATKKGSDLDGLRGDAPTGHFHPKSVLTAAAATDDPEWIWWNLPSPPKANRTF